jgi:hypothetical protein
VDFLLIAMSSMLLTVEKFWIVLLIALNHFALAAIPFVVQIVNEIVIVPMIIVMSAYQIQKKIFVEDILMLATVEEMNGTNY